MRGPLTFTRIGDEWLTIHAGTTNSYSKHRREADHTCGSHQYLTSRPSRARQQLRPGQNDRRARLKAGAGRRAGNWVGSHSGKPIWGVEASVNLHPTRKVTVGEATLQVGAAHAKGL